MEEESLKALRNHPWLIPMLKSKLFHERCPEHVTKKRCFFCCDCMTPPFCELCLKKLNKHDGHSLIQTYRSSYQSGVRVQTISKFIDTSNIFLYIINSHKIVYINQRREKEQSCRSNVTRKCEVCGWELDSTSSAKFCSIECKLRSDLGSKLDELMEKQETISQNEVPKSFRKRRRKGFPRRAPFF